VPFGGLMLSGVQQDKDTPADERCGLANPPSAVSLCQNQTWLAHISVLIRSHVIVPENKRTGQVIRAASFFSFFFFCCKNTGALALLFVYIPCKASCKQGALLSIHQIKCMCKLHLKQPQLNKVLYRAYGTRR